MKIVEITPEYEMMSNSYLLIDEDSKEAAIVDPGCFLDNARNAIKDNGVTLKYVLLTHGHFDHILGAYGAKKICGAEIVINEGDARCLSSREYSLMNMFNVQSEIYPTEADILVEDGDILKLGNTELQVMTTPGHSPGGVCYINHKDRVIMSGDTLFYSTVGRCDTYGASDLILQDSLRKLLALEGNYDVYPGHGPKTDLDHERVRNIYIRRMNRD